MVNELSRRRFLRVISADPNDWAERYGIEPFTVPCSGCGATRVTSIPFFSGTLRGLIAPGCECGCDSLPPYCVVRVGSAGDLFLLATRWHPQSGASTWAIPSPEACA